MGHAGMKRPPMLPTDLLGQFAKLSKADWADVFIDLYFQGEGIELPTYEQYEAAMADAERRAELLKNYRKQWAKQDAQEGAK